MLTGQGGNIGLLAGDDGVFVIDSQFAPIAPKNLAKINEIAGAAPKFLVNTHWHGDHTGGNGNFGANIIAHENTRKRLSTQMTINRAGNENVSEPTDPALWPVITFDDKLKLHLNGQTISAFHTPDAHTDTDVMVYFEEGNVLHMGDVFFKGTYPFIDVGSGGTVAGYIAAMKTAYAKCDENTKVIPGHGTLATREDIAASIAMLEGVQGAIAAAIADGMSAEDAVKANILAEWDEQWGSGFIKPNFMIALAYQDMTRPADAKGS
jgi:glyoxylase-like metal-dependent hydrolase (beta-lactamase superfamily II)